MSLVWTDNLFQTTYPDSRPIRDKTDQGQTKSTLKVNQPTLGDKGPEGKYPPGECSHREAVPPIPAKH